MMNNVAKSFDILAAWALYIIILMVQTKLFSELYLIKFVDILVKLFFYAILLKYQKFS